MVIFLCRMFMCGPRNNSIIAAFPTYFNSLWKQKVSARLWKIHSWILLLKKLIEGIFVLFICRLIHKIVNYNHTILLEGITRVKPVIVAAVNPSPFFVESRQPTALFSKAFTDKNYKIQGKEKILHFFFSC